MVSTGCEKIKDRQYTKKKMMNISERFRQKLKNISTLVDFVAMQTGRGIQTEMPAHMMVFTCVLLSIISLWKTATYRPKCSFQKKRAYFKLLIPHTPGWHGVEQITNSELLFFLLHARKIGRI